MTGSGLRQGAAARLRAIAGLRDALRASRPDIVLDDRGYCSDPADNLLPDLALVEIEAEFAAGAGAELDGKFRAPHSSSALAVNCLAPLRASGSSPPLAGMIAAVTAFEAKMPTGLPRAQPPHLDALARGPAGLVAIESKCLEPLSIKTPSFSPRYRDLAATQRPSRWFDEMIRLLDAPEPTYRRLDAAQLIKHALGLIAADEPRMTLLYLFWEPRNAADWPAFVQHRQELAAFADRVAGDELGFAARSYPELWSEWDVLDDPALTRHTAALRQRYDVVLCERRGLLG